MSGTGSRGGIALAQKLHSIWKLQQTFIGSDSDIDIEIAWRDLLILN
jgi:hypothetical protein